MSKPFERNFAGCCGAYELHDFWPYPDYSDIADNSVDNIKERVKDIVFKRVNTLKQAFLVIVLNPRQQELFNNFLLDTGWKVVSKRINRYGGGNMLKMYVYEGEKK